MSYFAPILQRLDGGRVERDVQHKLLRSNITCGSIYS